MNIPDIGLKGLRFGSLVKSIICPHSKPKHSGEKLCTFL